MDVAQVCRAATILGSSSLPEVSIELEELLQWVLGTLICDLSTATELCTLSLAEFHSPICTKCCPLDMHSTSST